MAIARPLQLQPILLPKVWGGERLRDFVAEEDVGEDGWPDGEPIGEVWLVCEIGRAHV